MLLYYCTVCTVLFPLPPDRGCDATVLSPHPPDRGRDATELQYVQLYYSPLPPDRGRDATVLQYVLNYSPSLLSEGAMLLYYSTVCTVLYYTVLY